MDEQENESIALHVLVVGFHHKKGMQIEYVYPPFNSEDGELPEKWKHLPSLCLPDGAHNHEADTIYFHLPHLTKDNQTVFGVSCYRQIDAEKVTNKTSDITRNTVQKSVCVLTTLPIYGYVQERLKVTTKVYFKGADFSDVRDLEGLHHDLNNTNWKDRLMHERKVLFYHSPVAPLARIITSLLALLPANLPDGLAQAAATRNECEKVEESEEVNENDNLDVTYSNPKPRKSIQISPSETLGEVKEELKKIINCEKGNSSDCPVEGTQVGDQISISEKASESDDELSERRSSNSSLTSVTSRGSIMSPPNSFQGTPIEPSQNFSSKISSLKGRLSGALNYWTGKEKISIAEKPSSTTTPNPSPSEPGDDVPISPSSGMPLPFPLEAQSDLNQLIINTEKYAMLEPKDCGLPLQIFTKGNLLHPYLSLQYLDVLTAPSTRAFIVGASNTLFIHKKNLYEVLVQLEDGKIEVADPELKRQLSLSIEDLRFAENLVRQVDAVSASVSKSPGGSEESILSQAPDVFLEGVGWMGGEEWIRHQFKVYLLTMLRSSLCPDVSRENEVFNSSFISAWKETHNYRMWLAGGPYPSLLELTPGHPHAGQLSMSDMRIRLSHTIQSLDKGRRLNQTLASTGTAVVKTKEAVGGAITSAKGALSTLWTSFTAPSSTAPREDGEDEAEEGIEALEDENSVKLLNQGEAENKENEAKVSPVLNNEDIQLENLS